MAEASEIKKNPVRRSLWKRRTVLYLIKVIIIAFCFCDWYFETKGLPRKLRRYVERRLTHGTLKFTSDKIKIGFMNGVVFTNPKFVDKNLSSDPILAANEISLPLYSSFAPFKTFIIEEGVIRLPLFPETGIEGRGDVVLVKNIDANIELEEQGLEVKYVSCKIENIELNGSGFFRSIMAMSLTNSSEEGVVKDKSFFLEEMISNISYEKRSKLFLLLQRFNKDNFPTPVECTIHVTDFNLDDFADNELTIVCNAKKFNYGSLPVDRAVCKVHTKGSLVQIEELNLDFNKANRFKFKAEIDLDDQSVSGKVSGLLTPYIINKLLGNSRIFKSEFIKFSDSPINFNSDVINYSFLTKQYKTVVDIKMPSVSIYDNTWSDIDSRFIFENEKISCDELTAKIGSDGDINLDFLYQPNRIKANLSGSITFNKLFSMLNNTAICELLEDYKLESGEAVVFNSSVDLDLLSKINNTKLEFSTKKLTVNSLDINDIDVKLDYDGSVITGKEFKFKLDNGTSVRSTLSLSPNDKTLVSHIVSKGSPLPILDLLPEIHKAQIVDKMSLLDFPENPEDVDVTIDSYFDWSDGPKLSLYGDLVLNNFGVKKHVFTYGATTFQASYKDLRWNILLPVIMLERPEGQAMMAICYSERDNRSFAVPTGEFEPRLKQVEFRIDSSLVGNIILDLFVQNWDKNAVNFPRSSNVQVEGVIDFMDDDKDYAKIDIQDADYFWDEFLIEHVSAVCLYKYGYLQVLDAIGKISDGDIVVNHESWLKKGKSKTVISVKNANFTDLVEQYDMPVPPGNKPGELSLNLILDGVHPAIGDDEFYGSGNVVVNDADLWSLPILGTLQDLIDDSWAFTQFGKISSLSSEFTIDKDHVHSDSIETDGSIFSLKAKGDYYWTSKKHLFKVQVKMFKNALPFKILSYAFSPLSWMFEAQLIGDEDGSQWYSTRKMDILRQK